MFYKSAICLTILFAVSAQVLAQKGKSKDNISNLAKDVKSYTKKVSECLPKKPTNKFEQEILKLLYNFIETWTKIKLKFLSLSIIKLSLKQWKALETLFEDIWKSILNYLKMGGTRITTNIMTVTQKCMNAFDNGMDKIVEMSKNTRGRINSEFMEWLDGYRQATRKFLKGCQALVEGEVGDNLAQRTKASTLNSKSRRQLDKLQKELKSTNQEILEEFPKNMNTEQKKSARKLLDKYIKQFKAARTNFKKKVNKKVSEGDWQELDKEFDNTVEAVEKLLSMTRSFKGKFNPLRIAKKSTDNFHLVVGKIVNICEKGGDKTVKPVIGWLGQCKYISSNFLFGVMELSESDGVDDDDDDDSDNDDDDDSYDYNDDDG